MAVLMTSHLRYDFDNPKHPNNDSLIFSKGHACPLLYSAYKAAGAITDEELLTLRQLGSRLEGHPTPDIRGSKPRPVRWVRACPSASAMRSPASFSTSCLIACGSFSATAKWLKAACGKPLPSPITTS
jgi:hypothetical protein